MLVWISMGTALWHFTIFMPDRFHGGIIGAFLAANLGAGTLGVLWHGLSIPASNDLAHAIQGLIGAVLGLTVSYLWGMQEQTVDAQQGVQRRRARRT
jgi:hypothetical protein